MATNKLMEAAADILTQSKKSAPSDPMHKMSTQVVDVGGPTPENYKPDDDSAKLDTTKAVDNSAASKNAASIKMKASAASAKMEEAELENYSLEELEEFMVSEEFEQLDELSKDTLKSYRVKSIGRDSNFEKKGYVAAKKDGGAGSDRADQLFNKSDLVTAARKRAQEKMKEKMKEDVDALFADDSTISEEFKEKVSTIFEARVQDRVTQIEEEIEEKYTSMLEEAIDDIKTDLTNKVDDYLNYVVEQWLTDNEIAIESGLRAELTEEFIAGLRNLFAEHYIDVPTEKVDLVDELAGKVEELESKLNEEIERGISYAKALVESRKNELSREVCDGLTTTQAEKIKSLAEGVEFSTEEEYTNKLETIRENYFPSGIKKANEQQLHEIVEDAGEQKVINDPFVAAVSNAISKTKF